VSVMPERIWGFERDISAQDGRNYGVWTENKQSGTGKQIEYIRADVATAPVAAERSRAIREFCQKANIKGSVEAANLPEDVRMFRAEFAFRAKGWPVDEAAAIRAGEKADG
jgi:hypothetical protein